ncbi:hypothetical protein LTR96_009416 [Exophiala xenobiotica]|nr:hypothetical protein LTR92_010316 [Exophiala xenobiotica]KAK5217146.1 hypothetical protein LTR72_009712 [Exophiala xenobiotica]KAK5244578.1 hypothetical protein LTS06_009876 [Exophiala xenobiotica]KAK5265049.1 hypothetical protein LTR96_009416 [Exophiala xenobiotica]KAK5281853.1 hypothetical protein LTR40_004195 [Exophiala xenobiotica]
MPISLAILGAGIFAREGKSASQKSAETLASESESKVDVYYDSPTTAGKSVDDLLKRSDIDAVIICVPILAQPEFIRKAMKAGKHVLSEKPIAKDVVTAEELIKWREASSIRTIWAVGENFRFISPVVYGHAKLKEIGGQVTTFSMNLFALIDENDKFYQTEWRKTPEYQGGFLLDGGVHFVAGMRYLLSAVGEDISSLAAYTALLEPKLAPVDTVHGILLTTSGRSGSFNVSFGTEFKGGFEIFAATNKGSVSVSPVSVKVVRKDAEGKKVEEEETFAFGAGVKAEVEAFAASIESGTPDPRQTPQQALGDLIVLQGLLESGENKGAVKTVKL